MAQIRKKKKLFPVYLFQIKKKKKQANETDNR